MTPNGQQKVGDHWVPDKIKPYSIESSDAFPTLTEEWRSILETIKARTIASCHDCHAPDYLCKAHENSWGWVIRMAKANIPRRYWPLEIEDTFVQDQDGLTFIKDVIANIADVVRKGLSISLFGTRGCGKTTLTIYTLKAGLRAGFSGYFILMESLLSLIKESFDSADAKERLKDIRSVDILVLDDLGREYVAKQEFVVARLDELFRWRDSMGLSTLFSSNLSGEEFRARYGGGIISLLSNTNKPLHIKGDDLRSKLNEWGGK